VSVLLSVCGIVAAVALGAAGLAAFVRDGLP